VFLQFYFTFFTTFDIFDTT